MHDSPDPFLMIFKAATKQIALRSVCCRGNDIQLVMCEYTFKYIFYLLRMQLILQQTKLRSFHACVAIAICIEKKPNLAILQFASMRLPIHYVL